MQGRAGHRVAIHLEDEEVVDLPLDLGPGAAQQFVAVHAGLDQGVDGPRIVLLMARRMAWYSLA